MALVVPVVEEEEKEEEEEGEVMDFTPRRVKTNTREEGTGRRDGREKEIFHHSDSIRDAW